MFTVVIRKMKLFPLIVLLVFRCRRGDMSKGWLLPQPSMRRLRPIFEPLANASCDRTALAILQYPSRLERRHRVVNARFVAEFDYRDVTTVHTDTNTRNIE